MEIELQNVTKTFGHTNVIENVSMRLHSGRVYGLQGINGCGKTMLMRLISGLIHPTSGRVLVNGRPLEGENSFPESMGLLIENPAFLKSFTGRKNLEMLASIRGRIDASGVRAALERVGLSGEADKRYGKYSLGMRQKLGIACAVMERPELILFLERKSIKKNFTALLNRCDTYIFRTVTKCIFNWRIVLYCWTSRSSPWTRRRWSAPPGSSGRRGRGAPVPPPCPGRGRGAPGGAAVKKLIFRALAALWGLWVYALNHDPVVEFSKRKTVEYAAGETVDLTAGTYPAGWADLTGYHMRITGARLVRTLDLLEDNGFDATFFDNVDYGEDYALVLLVDTVFWFDGERDPAASDPVELTNLRLVGSDWSCWYSKEINDLGFLNPALKNGSNAFAIVTGRELKLTLPFIIREDAGGFFDKSINGVTAVDILKHPPRLLACEYPTQVYAGLPLLT